MNYASDNMNKKNFSIDAIKIFPYNEMPIFPTFMINMILTSEKM